MLRFSDTFIRKKVKGGEFSPAGADGEPDLTNIIDVDGDLRVPASGVNLFLRRYSLRYDAGVKARNAGELRRKLGRVQTFGPEVER